MKSKKTVCEIFRDSNCKSCAAVIAAKFRRATQRERIRDNKSSSRGAEELAAATVVAAAGAETSTATAAEAAAELKKEAEQR